jgi:hypothetical protein
LFGEGPIDNLNKPKQMRLNGLLHCQLNVVNIIIVNYTIYLPIYYVWSPSSLRYLVHRLQAVNVLATYNQKLSSADPRAILSCVCSTWQGFLPAGRVLSVHPLKNVWNPQPVISPLKHVCKLARSLAPCYLLIMLCEPHNISRTKIQDMLWLPLDCKLDVRDILLRPSTNCWYVATVVVRTWTSHEELACRSKRSSYCESNREM